jgi:hypothetical protein
MSSPVPNADYGPDPNEYERIGPGHYRRREDDPEAYSVMKMIDRLKAVNPLYDESTEGESKSADQIKPLTSLEAIAIDIRGLPYGEFMEMAEGIGAKPDILWKWATK